MESRCVLLFMSRSLCLALYVLLFMSRSLYCALYSFAVSSLPRLARCVSFCAEQCDLVQGRSQIENYSVHGEDMIDEWLLNYCLHCKVYKHCSTLGLPDRFNLS